MQSHPSQFVDGELKTIDNALPEIETEVEHVVYLPTLCLKSQNPKAGSLLRIRYTAAAKLLELFALDRYIQAYIGHPTVRDMEYFVQVIALECGRALGQPVTVLAEIEFNQVAQGQRIEATYRP
ncbi:MAG: hypothetical protein HWE20_02610 [Gammaproteobacteria bacterium]|nr:hypothetical protein [Gammaproteobacteria bacterium]